MIFDERFAREVEQWRRRNQYYYNDILRLLRFYVVEGSSVLQIGNDDGWVVSSLNPSRGVYVAMSEALAREGEKKFKNIEFVVDAHEDKLTLNEKFDYVVLVNSIGSAPDLQSYFARLSGVVKPSTRIIITYYNYLWQPIIRLAEALGLKQKLPTQHWLSSIDINNVLTLTGFEVIKEGRRMLFPKNIPILSRFLNNILGRLPLIDRFCFCNYAIARPRFLSGDTARSVSVIVPARNEKATIEAVVKRVPAMGAWTEIIFVEWGSTDGTWEEIQRVYQAYRGKRRIKIFQHETSNKGEKVRKGFDEAQGDIVMILDSDLAVPPESLPRFYDVIASGLAEYAHGNRLIYPMEKEAMRFLNLVGNKFFSFAFSWLLKQRLKDTLCGTKVLSGEDYRKLDKNRKYFGDFDPFGDFDLVFGASKLALKIIEIPIHYKERVYGKTNISRFRHGWLLLKMIIFAMKKFE